MSHVLEYFQRIYIINLPERTDRYREMEIQLRRVGLSYNSPNVEVYPAIRPTAAGGFPSIGARGCFMSHLGVLQNAIQTGVDRILILEDDLNFCSDFMARVAYLVPRLERIAWHVFYGGYDLKFLPVDGDHDLVNITNQCPRNTHFVGFQGTAISDIANHLVKTQGRPPGDPDGGPMHVDGAYCWFRRKHPHISTWLAVPVLGFQRSSRSDVHKLTFLDRLPVVREGVAVLRRILNRLKIAK